MGPIPLDTHSQPQREHWDQFVARQKPTDRQIRDLVAKLHTQRKHDQVVHLIEAALVSGKSQPWMYDVLAIEMEIVGRPKSEIERVLLSRVDFSATDVPSMLYSAAYLTRFGADKRALDLYRQASTLAVERPEPYVLGLKIARQLKDHDSVGWAANGILTYAWTDNFQQLHRKAEIAAEESQRELLAAGDRASAKKLSDKILNAKHRDLQIRLTWNGPGDLDLVVEEPFGTICSPTRPQSPGGGVLVHDGSGPRAANSYDAYVCAMAAAGTYKVHVRHIRGDIVGKRAILTVVRYSGTSRESKKTLTIPLSSDDVIVRIPLSAGRREKADAPVDRLTVDPNRQGRAQTDRRRAASEARNAARSFNKSRRTTNTGNAPRAGAGNFVGYQPVISTINEGGMLNVGAIISADRRYVRLNLTPSFSSLVDIATFSAFSR